jgi:hypothetical protein
MSSSYDSSDEEWDLQEEEISVLLAMHADQTWWFRFWSTKVVAGNDRRAQQVDAELFCGESNIFGEIFSSPFLDEHQLVQAYHKGADEV